MKVSQLFCQTLREAPSDAKLPGHVFLLRGGYIRQVSAGSYSLTPLGLRVCRKVEGFIRSEMDAVGGQEVDLPLVLPAELWKESGRYDAIGDELLRFRDRTGHDMVLAMTHEEAVTDLVRQGLSSYRQFPFMLYQFKLKYRDEARPRAGLIRVREFVMKDAYSFHKDEADLDIWYEKLHKSYVSVFRKAGIEPVVVQSDSGIMGGKVAHEFMLETPHGEDHLILCDSCGLQANAEIASFDRGSFHREESTLEKVATPHKESIEEVAEFLKTESTSTIKAVFYQAGERLVAALVRGDLEISEIKLRNLLRVPELVPAESELIRAAGMEPGYASLVGVGLSDKFDLVLDTSLQGAVGMVVGANEAGFHFTGCSVERDFAEGVAEKYADIAQAGDGATCPDCGKTLRATRGIEIGNIFKLGTKFSETLGATFLDEDSKEQPAVMGCYGIGVGRLMASVAEAHHDDWGILWPKSIAPYQVQILLLGKDDSLKEASEKLYANLTEQGYEVLYDDRDERAGVKFKDADLWGVPVRISVGKKSLAQGAVEWKLREGKNFDLVSLDDVESKLREFYS